ncbi:hypothetical protein ZEAMMB73_Zm00001d052723 [Zea mays]|nr:hypothetical protein ZEAMMB73_Zm00001d052723 [Zea mays]
MAYLSRR